MSLVGALCTTALHAQTGGINNDPPKPFDVYWGVGGQYASGLSLRGAPVKQAACFGGVWFGLYPVAGPHMIERYPGGREQFYADHLAKIAVDMAYFVPDPVWTGLAVIDWENMQPFWTGAYNAPSTQAYDAPDFDMLDDWRDYIREFRPQLLTGLSSEKQEQVFKETYLAATREFYTRTLRECKRLRPSTRWSVYFLPRAGYYPFTIPNYGVFAQQRADLETAHMAELEWLLDEVDVVCPSVYTFFRSNASYTGTDVDTFADSTVYQHDAVDYAVRFARGRKPVIPFIWYHYHDSTIHVGQTLSEFNMRTVIVQAAAAGADGVFVWGHVPAPYWRTQLQTYIDTTLGQQIAFYTRAVAEMRRSNTPPSQWFFQPPWSNTQPSLNVLQARLNAIVLSRPTNPNVTPPNPLGVVTILQRGQHQGPASPAPAPPAAAASPLAQQPASVSPSPSPSHRERLRGNDRRRGHDATKSGA